MSFLSFFLALEFSHKEVVKKVFGDDVFIFSHSVFSKSGNSISSITSSFVNFLKKA